MRIVIAADMEGITGVVHWDHTTATHTEYARFRQLMTGDVNAAVAGACDGGATDVVVSDGHGSGRNVLIEDLDVRARLHSGGPRPLSMVEGVGPGTDGVIFVGYHAKAGTPAAILDHTWIGAATGVWLNGTEVGEIGLNAAVCGHFGVPVIALAGCRAACAEGTELLGAQLETAAVKTATGRMSAECLPPAATAPLIRTAAARATERLRQGSCPSPWRVTPPIELTVEFNASDLTDRAGILPGVRRDRRRLSVTAADMLQAYRLFQVLTRLA